MSAPFLIAAGQMLADQADGMQAQRVRNRLALRGCHRFHSVGKRVQPGRGGHPRREADRELRVQDRHVGDDVVVREQELAPALVVLDHRHVRHLGARARGGRYADVRGLAAG